MSSHHIVREKQEPALLVLGMERFPGRVTGPVTRVEPYGDHHPAYCEKLDTVGIGRLGDQ